MIFLGIAWANSWESLEYSFEEIWRNIGGILRRICRGILKTIFGEIPKKQWWNFCENHKRVLEYILGENFEGFLGKIEKGNQAGIPQGFLEGNSKNPSRILCE